MLEAIGNNTYNFNGSPHPRPQDGVGKEHTGAASMESVLGSYMFWTQANHLTICDTRPDQPASSFNS